MDVEIDHGHPLPAPLGAGVMGGDIAALCALRGLTVTLQDQSLERIAPALARATTLFEKRLREPLRVRDARAELQSRGDRESSYLASTAELALLVGDSETLQRLAASLSPGQPVYILLYASLIMFFCFFYTALVFNSRETADNLRKSGAFIPGIRPGQQTAEYIDKVLTRLTFWGALYITAVCLLPEFMILEFSVPFYFGGTSVLIMVVVTMDFMAQLQAHMMTHQYEGLLKKANLRGYGKSDS